MLERPSTKVQELDIHKLVTALEVKKITQKGLSFLLVLISVAPVVMFAFIVPRRGRTCPCLRRGSLNDLVELAPVQPYAPALRTIIDFNSAPVRHYQVNITNGTLHIFIYLYSCLSLQFPGKKAVPGNCWLLLLLHHSFHYNVFILDQFHDVQASWQVASYMYGYTIRDLLA